jgi:ABC-type Na+ efflux pump permease subunit
MLVNEGLFCAKYLFVLALFIALLYVNNDLFIDYADASKYISVLFMVLQVGIPTRRPSYSSISSTSQA